MRVLFKSTLAFLAIGITTGASAATYTLDFTGNICGGGACGNGSTIDQTYGDVPGEVDVTADGNLGTAAIDPAFHWSTGYETLVNVAYGNLGGGGLGFTFAAAAGKAVTINGFDIAPYLNRVRNSRVRIIDGVTATELFDSGLLSVSTTEVTSFTNPGNWTSSLITIALGPDAWDVGIDNISYTVADVANGGGVNTIPLPAAGWLLLGGLGALGGLARRRTA